MNKQTNNYLVHTYSNLIATLHAIEQEEIILHKIKTRVMLIGMVSGLLIVSLSIYFCKYIKLTAIETITSYGAPIVLGPAFGYVYYGIQAWYMHKRKAGVYKSLHELFTLHGKALSPDEITNMEFIKKMLNEKLLTIINEKVKYE